MEAIVYYSRNGKKPPFEVTIELEDQTVYINCNCPLGVEKKICRHKIMLLEVTRKIGIRLPLMRLLHGSDIYSELLPRCDNTIKEKWRLLREFASENPSDEEGTDNKRRILGETFANGFLNENSLRARESFDVGEWEDTRDVYADGLNCTVTLKYVNNEGVPTARDVIVEEIFVSNSQFYILGYCSLRKQRRTFRVDRIQAIDFSNGCNKSEKSVLLDVIFQGKQITRTLP